MKYLFALALAFATLSAQAATQDQIAIQRVQKMAASQFSRDFRVVAAKTNDEICGAEGPSFVAQVQVKHLEKKLNDKTGSIELVASWETVKTYGIPASELADAKNPSLMDSEACLE